MSFTSWLRTLRSALAPSRMERKHRRQPSLRATTYRPRLEVLDDRCLPSIFTVTNLLDSGPDSLRAAVAAANANPGADDIDFATTGTIGLTSGQLDITDSVTINGPGASALTVSGNHASRVFGIIGDPTVTIPRGINPSAAPSAAARIAAVPPNEWPASAIPSAHSARVFVQRHTASRSSTKCRTETNSAASLSPWPSVSNNATWYPAAMRGRAYASMSDACDCQPCAKMIVGAGPADAWINAPRSVPSGRGTLNGVVGKPSASGF